MSLTQDAAAPLLHGDRFFIGGEWTKPSSNDMIHVTDLASATLKYNSSVADRHDELLEALAASFSKVQVGSPFDAATQLGPLAAERQATVSRATSPRGWGDARHRWWAAEGSRARLVRRAARPRQRRQPLHHRPGGDLRASAERNSS